MMKGVNFQFTATNKTGPAMQGVQNGMRGVAKATDAANRANQSMMRGMSDNRRAVQQMGFQIADFSVQIAGGQDKMLAFAQQGGQVLQFFGAFGAVAGAALAVGAAVWMSWAKGAESATALGEAMDELNKLGTNLKGQLDMLRLGVDTQAEATVLQSLIDLERERANLKAQYAATDNLNTRQRLAEAIWENDRQRTIQQTALDGLNQRREAATNLDRFNRGMQAVEMGHYRAVGQAEAERVRQGQEIYRGMLAVQGAHQKVSTEAKKTADGMTAAGIAAANLAGIDFSNITGAAAETLRMAQALAAVSSMQVGGASYLASQYAQYGAGRTAGEQLAKERGSLYGAAEPFLKPPKTTKKASSGGGAKSDPLAELQAKLKLETQMLGMSEAQQRVVQALGADWQKYDSVVITGLTGQIEAINAFNQQVADQQNIAKTIKSSMSDAFMGIVDGTMKAKDAFKSMAASVIKELFRILVVQRLVNTVAGFFGFGGGPVAALSGSVASFAGGGYTGYGARSGGVDGKGGFPAILHPNESVVDHTAGQGTGGVTVVQHNTFGSGVTRAEVQSMVPKIVEATKAAVLDARKRGGAYGGAFA